MSANEPPTRLTDRKRQDVLDAAALAFQQDGYRGASMDRIAAIAEVSKRTVYRHFSCKENLFRAILDDLFERPAQLTSTTYDASRTLDDQLRDIGRDYADMLMSEDFVRLARVVLSRFLESPELAAAVSSAKEKSKEALTGWIKAAVKDGRLRVPNSLRAARQFAGLIQEFALWPQVLGSEPPLSTRERNQIVESAVRMFLAIYAIPSPAPRRSRS